MDYTRTRVVNVILGLICIAIETFVYNWSIFTDLPDKIYLGVVSFFTLEAFIAIFVVGNKPENIWERLWRIVCCMVLMGTGTWLIVSALEIEDQHCFNNRKMYKAERCHHYEMKLGVGVLAILNGILYLFANAGSTSTLNKIPENRKVYVSPEGIPVRNPYEPPADDGIQPVYTMPRAHLQSQPPQLGYSNPSMYNNNTAPASQYSGYQYQPQQPVAPVKKQAPQPPPGYNSQQVWNYNQPTRRY